MHEISLGHTGVLVDGFVDHLLDKLGTRYFLVGQIGEDLSLKFAATKIIEASENLKHLIYIIFIIKKII